MSPSATGSGLTLTIGLAALARNWRRLSASSAPAECAAVVKADAYGIGIQHAAPALWRAGCRTFFVALPEEGAMVRGAAPEAAIYVLNGYIPEREAVYRSHDLRPVLNQEHELAAWRASGGGPAGLHVDTGMNRLGFATEAAGPLAQAVRDSGADIRLLISHLACADAPDHPKNAEQLARFQALRTALPALPASLANSAGIRLGPDYHFDMVRPGIALYTDEVVVTAETRILQVRSAESGETVGYGATHTLPRRTRLAILAAGYADGYMRAAGASDDRPGAAVFIRGRRAPLIGRVSMDLIVADVSGLPEPPTPGDRAELFGENITIHELATAAATIPYELLTNLSRRAERVYLDAPEAGDG